MGDHTEPSLTKAAPPIIVQVAPARPIVQVAAPLPVRAEQDISGLVTAWATVALVIATGVLAYLTWVLAQATSRPSIIATFEPVPDAPNLMELHIVNEGNASAFDIQLEFTPPLPETGGQVAQIKYPRFVAVLAAGQKVECFLCDTSVLIDKAYDVHLSWRAKPQGKRRTTTRYTLDLGYMRSMLTRDHKLVGEQLAKIAKSAEIIANKVSR